MSTIRRYIWMRTTLEENDAFGRWIAGKLNQCEGPVRVSPFRQKGVSAIVTHLERSSSTRRPTPRCSPRFGGATPAKLTSDRLISLPLHINDAAFLLMHW